MILQKIVQKLLFPKAHTDYFNVQNPQGKTFTTSKEKRYKTIQNITKLLVTTIEFDKLAQEIVDLMVEQMDYLGGILFLPDENQKILIPWTTSDAPIVRAVLKRLPKGIREFSQRYDIETENLIAKTFIEGIPMESNDYSNFVSPALPKINAQLIQRFAGIKMSIAYPVTYQGKTIAVMMFNSAKGKILKEDHEMLQTFTELVGVSMYNAKLFGNLKTYNEQLKIKNSDLASLYNLSSKVSESLDPNLVAQTAVNSLPQDKFLIGSIISTFDEDTNTIGPIAVTQNELAHQAQNIVGDFTKLRVNINDEQGKSNLAVRAYIEEKRIYTDDVGKYMEPVVFSNVISSVLKLINIKSIAIHPITWKNETHGVITYFIKDKTAGEVTDSEKQLLDTYTSHITIALENAELYKMQKQIQEELETAYQQVQSLRQHEQDMIDIMGHELRTPITIVRNSLGVMEMEFNKNGTIPEDKLKRYIDIAMESARREVRLVETLLSSAKADSRGFQLMFEKVDVADAIQDSLDLFTKEGQKKGIDVVFKSQGEYFAYADRVRTQEIVDNLLSNAVKYTDNGKVEVTLNKDSDHVIIEVSDTGIGMTKEDIQRLGKKFYRVDQYVNKENERPEETKNVIRPGGTGLGLYVAFSLIKIMNGSYEVESEVDKGSKFTVKLPIYNGQPNKQEQRKVEEK